jgi:hypothetical protein
MVKQNGGPRIDSADLSVGGRHRWVLGHADNGLGPVSGMDASESALFTAM